MAEGSSLPNKTATEAVKEVPSLEFPPQIVSLSIEDGQGPTSDILSNALGQRDATNQPPRLHLELPTDPVSSPINPSTSLFSFEARRQSRISQWSPIVPPEIEAIPSPRHEAPGQYIDKDEQDGLPGTESLEVFAEQRAQYVVRVHTRQRSKRNSGLSVRTRRRFLFSGENQDVEHDGYSIQDSLSPSYRGGGVLSTLLRLYDQDPPSDADESRDITPDPVDRTPLQEQNNDHNHTLRQEVDAHTPQEEPWDGKIDMSTPRPSSPDVLPPPDASWASSPTNNAHGRKRGNTLNSILSGLFSLSTRPVQARNGGGVFGPLIASTGNITSPATPAASTVAPSVKRSGYQLSRYSLETGMPTCEVPQQRCQGTDCEKVSLSSNSSPPSPSSPHDSIPKSSRTKWTNMRSMVNGLKGTWGSSAQIQANDTWFDEKSSDRSSRGYWRRKRKKTEIYITRHVAQIIQRQEFISKLTRAMMMFGAPSHCLPGQIQSTARVLDIKLSCMYLPDVVLISFDDPSTGTSQIRFIRQGSILNMDKLQDAYKIYWKVIHDDISVGEASQALDNLMRRKQLYSWWQLMLIGGMCSGSICTLGFSGSFLDSVVSVPLGALLVAVQLLSAKNDLYSNIFEIMAATVLSFVSAAVASGNFFCYSAIISSSVVLILPGPIVLTGALEVSSRNIVSGSVRMVYAIIYSMFLGFGLAIGAQTYEKITGIQILDRDDVACAASHPPGSPWYQSKANLWWAFLTVPVFALFQSLRNFAPIFRKEMVILILIACSGWATNHFTASLFKNQADMSAAAGAFVVGFIANVYARVFSGNAFAIMVSGMLLQLPSGLGSDGLMSVNQLPDGPSTTYISGLQTALQLVSVTIGLTVGLGTALVVVHPIQSKRRAVFSL